MRINRKNALLYSMGFITKNASNSMQNRSEIAQKEISEIAAELVQAELEIVAETEAEISAAEVAKLSEPLDPADESGSPA